MNTLLFLDLNLDPEATVEIVRLIIGGLSSTAIILYLMKFFLETVVRKYINDNAPSFAQADINARNKVRLQKIKAKYSDIKFALLVGAGIYLLKLHNAGIIKLKEDKALILAIFLMGLYIIKNVDWDKMKVSVVSDFDSELEKDLLKFKEDYINKNN